MKTAEIAHITDEAAHALRGVTVQENDVLINITGDSIARTSIVDPLVLPARVNQHVAIIRANSLVSASYLQRFLVNPEQKARLIAGSDGGTRNALTKSALEEIQVAVPPMQVQLGIAEVLGALDDKILANTTLASNLDNLASAQFEVARNAAGEKSKLSDLVATQYGLTTPAHSGPGPKLLRVTDINKKPWVEWGTTPSCSVTEPELEKYRVRPGDILVARMADPGKSAYIDENHPDAVFASYLVRLIAHDPTMSPYIYYFLRSGDYKRYAEGASQGTVQKNMNAKVIVGAEIEVPNSAVLSEFSDRTRSLRCQVGTLLAENATLAELRDTLLPELMSGRLRVKAAEKQIEEVL
tara:strand:+ start:781 stop:1842 length:1062 start_codon:yes stop_codon:yes gene_type:complete